MKTTFITFLLLWGSSLMAQSDHICQILMQNEHTEEELKQCIDEFGKPQSLEEAEQVEHAQKESEQEQAELLEEKYTKIFEGSEIKKYGVPFVAVRNFYNYGAITNKETMTKADHLCRYLGFDESVGEPVLSQELHDFENKDFLGVYINRNFFGKMKDAKQFKLWPSKRPSSIHTYKKLACRKDRQDEDPVGAMIENVETMNSMSSTSKSSVQVNDEPRESNPQDLSPYLYKSQEKTNQR